MKFVLLLIGILVISGCTSQQQQTIGSSQSGLLPVVNGWSLEKTDVESPEGLQVESGIYQNGDKIVVLTVVKGISENVVKNTILAMMYETIEEPTINEGLVGKNAANYATDGNIHAVFFSSDTIGYFAVCDLKQDLTEFLSVIYENVLIE